MTDRNGVEIKIGDKAVVLSTGLNLEGKVGDVRDIKDRTLLDGKERARVSDGPEENLHWSAWLASNELTVIT